ncbi:aldo/keto reductase [Streptomyces gardneri]|uniref:aldo/keto reductase n=1 Tax=Nocardia TaxID=1817 RepID=UPI00135989F3|nr:MULTISPECIES: aldo/keto reductase [Nocardia]MBF6169140.1 aldo/keto reductase [Streptomyces gardneri]UAK33386.1 aldo/keto reductase [Nocardia asteroides]
MPITRSRSSFSAASVQGENLNRNLELVRALDEIAARKDASVAQLAIAWVLTRGADIVPVIGTRRRRRWAEAVNALDISLTEEELSTIEAAVPADRVAGERYATAQMAMLDSER